jgi:hypothetical protein
MICQWAQASSSLTKFDRRKDKYHEYDEEEKEKKKNRVKETSGDPRKVSQVLISHRGKLFSTSKTFLFWSPPFAPWRKSSSTGLWVEIWRYKINNRLSIG